MVIREMDVVLWIKATFISARVVEISAAVVLGKGFFSVNFAFQVNLTRETTCNGGQPRDKKKCPLCCT
jgi:hypothetical protein